MVLDVSQNRERLENLNIHQFVVRVGEFGGYAVVETDDMAGVEKLTTIFAAFRVRLEPSWTSWMRWRPKPRGSRRNPSRAHAR